MHRSSGGEMEVSVNSCNDISLNYEGVLWLVVVLRFEYESVRNFRILNIDSYNEICNSIKYSQQWLMMSKVGIIMSNFSPSHYVKI